MNKPHTGADTCRCRARVSSACYDGRHLPATADQDAWYEDGTYDGATIVCDACYIMLGTPPLASLEPAIARMRRHQRENA